MISLAFVYGRGTTMIRTLRICQAAHTAVTCTNACLGMSRLEPMFFDFEQKTNSCALFWQPLPIMVLCYWLLFAGSGS